MSLHEPGISCVLWACDPDDKQYGGVAGVSPAIGVAAYFHGVGGQRSALLQPHGNRRVGGDIPLSNKDMDVQ